MTTDLTIFFMSIIEVEIVPVQGERLMEYMDAIWFHRFHCLTKEINEMADGGCYDHL